MVDAIPMLEFKGPAKYSGKVEVVDCGLCNGYGKHEYGKCAHCNGHGKVVKPKIEGHGDSPIHIWFGLTYSRYFTIPRMALEAMPWEWQERFVKLMEEAEAIGIETPTYEVRRRDKNGQFVSDPWGDYRHPDKSLLPESLR